MRRGFAGLTLLAIALVAAAPAPRPVITIEGVTTAVKLDATVRVAITKQVAGLNAGLEKFVALHSSYAKASGTQRDKLQRDMTDLHEKCKALHDAIAQKLDPAQREAFFAYLHAQMKAAGVDLSQMEHGGMMPDGAHDHGAMHGVMSGTGHGG